MGQLIACLTDRYGEKGKKADPGVLYGIKSHLWNAVALAAYWVDKEKGITK